MKIFKKILVQLLTLLMVLNLAVVACAEEVEAEEVTYTIKITNPTALIVHTYEVYQIFKGDVMESEIENVDSNDVLSNVTWGSGVNSDNYDTIKTDLTTDATSPLFTAAYNAVDGDPAETAFDEMTDVQKIAYVLAKHKSNFELVKEFSRVISANLSTKKEVLTATDKNHYSKAGFVGGYYLIKDADGSLENTNETYTSNMLQVVGDTDIRAKGGTVTVDKAISVGGTLKEAHDYNIGDTVDYVITGTMPYNYNRFTTFMYKFGDTLSKGLTYKPETLKVYLLNSGSKVELPKVNETTHQVYWTTTDEVKSDGKTNIEIIFDDMKLINDRTIDSQTQVIVEYQAVVNEDALIGTSNPNEVDLTFSNDPYDDTDYTTTPKDVVHAFVFQLDINKIDGASASTKLKGAQFVLWRESMGAKQYAIVENGQLTGWADYKDEQDRTDRDGAATAAIATQLTTNNDGLIEVAGLKSDVYFLQETKAPEGYNLDTNVIEVDIDAVVSENTDGDGVVDSLTITVNGGTAHNGSNGVVSMTVVNNQGATLPETGGIGTTIFYVLGGFMVVAATVLLISKKRMASEA